MLSVSRSRVGVTLSLALGLLFVPLAALAADRPNLKVTSLTSPALTTPATHLLPGDSITITAIVTNVGLVATEVPAQSDNATKFFLVPVDPDPPHDPSGSKKNLKGIQIIKTPLAPNESDGSEATYALFSDTSDGTYKLQACADGFSFVAESSESDNCTTSTELLIVDKAPDLIVSAIKTPSLPNNQVGVGGSFQVQNTVKNIGPAPSGESVTTYFLVSGAPDNIQKDLKGPLPKPSDPPGGPDVPAVVPPLDANGGDADETNMVTVRPETVPGTYFLKACADGKKLLPEQDNDNNCLTSSGSFKVVSMPDLVVTSLTIDPPLPQAVAPGAALNIKANVLNQGGAPATKQSALKAVLVKVNTNPEVQKNLKLTSALTVDPLAANTSALIDSGTKVTVYSDTSPGVYLVRICADLNKTVLEAVESNNCLDSNATDSTQTLTVQGPTSNADLQVSAVADVQCSPEACADVVPGDMISAKVTVQNAGTETVAASDTKPVSIGFKLVQGTKEKSLKVIDANSMLIKQPILPGASVGPLSIQVQVFPDTLEGAYEVLVCADDKKAFAESSENNNCASQPPVCSTSVIDPLVTPNPPTKNPGNGCKGAPLGCTFGTNGTCTGQFHQITPAPLVTVHGATNTAANLVVTSLSNPPSYAQLGGSFSMTLSAKNIGVADATTATHTKYTLVTLATPPVVVADLSSPTGNTVPALIAGASAITDKETVTIRTNTPLGEYKVQVCLDSNKIVNETNETDNCRVSSGKIVVDGLPDYVVSSIAVTNPVPQVKRGGRINLTTMVLNQGLGKATKDSILKFDLVSTTGGPSSPLTGTKTIANLDSGESTALLTASVTVPSGAPFGTYKVRGCADATDVLLESGTGPLGSSEQNNCTMTSTTVDIVPQ